MTSTGQHFQETPKRYKLNRIRWVKDWLGNTKIQT